jgi:hypothetical protein
MHALCPPVLTQHSRMLAMIGTVVKEYRVQRTRENDRPLAELRIGGGPLRWFCCYEVSRPRALPRMKYMLTTAQRGTWASVCIRR